jgi:hypothetical protein
MTLDDLMQRGGFVAGSLVERKVTGAEADGGPVDFKVWIKEPTAATMERLGRDVSRTGEGIEDVARRPMMVSLAVFFDADGKQGISYEQACDLRYTLCTALYEAVADVLKVGTDKAKNSQPPTSSGTSSSSTESAAEQ